MAKKKVAKKKAAKKKAAKKTKTVLRADRGAGLEFNHAMIYVRALDRSLAFYRDALGFELLETYPGAYARLKSPRGSTSIALHVLDPGQTLDPKVHGIRLYFEAGDLDARCAKLAADGVKFKQMPEDMPWGWRHAYLDDPDGHELSLFKAGPKRFERTR